MVIYTHAGPEISVASTKAYMVQLSVFYLIAFSLAYAVGKITKDECIRLTSELQNVPYVIEEILKKPDECQYVASQLVNSENLLYIGRGLDYAIMREGDLKLKEITYLSSECYAAGELKHGPISLIDKDTLVIAGNTNKLLYEKTESNLSEVKARGANIILVTRR